MIIVTSRMITKVRKRDGRLEAFDKSRIIRAIQRAFVAVERPLDEMPEKLANDVISVLSLELSQDVAAVEEIQDVVERTLIKNDLPDVVKAYILYRRQRADVRDFKSFIGVKDDLKMGINALTVLHRRYLLRDAAGNVVETPSRMFRRVARAIAVVDKRYSPKTDVKSVEDTFYSMMVSREFLPNSPTLMNAGTSLGQLSACFVIPVEDSLTSIFDAVKATALIHQSGGGTGYSFSRLRPRGDYVKTSGGVASGPVSFMKIFDVTTEQIKQGGKRRGANMGLLSVYHPDILEFVTSKSRPETLTNFNISVAVDDAFMHAVEENREIELINPRDNKIASTISATELFHLISTKAWETGDPGLVFVDEINRTNPTPKVGAIEATNPCVVGSARISTDRGLVKISDLARDNAIGGVEVAVDYRVQSSQSGNSSLSLMALKRNDIDFHKVSRIFCVGEKQTFTLTTESGYELTCTADHKLLTNDGWVKAIDLKLGEHKIMLQCGEGKFGSSYELPFLVKNEFVGRNGKITRLNLPRNWTIELGQVLGWLIGDGWLRNGDKNCRVGFTFGPSDYEVLQYLKPILCSWYGSKIREVRRENGVFHLSFHNPTRRCH